MITGIILLYASGYAFTTLTNQYRNNLISHWWCEYLVGSQCNYHIQNISSYVWHLPLLIISSQNSITMHTSLHKRPAPEMTICSSNLISPWAAMRVNENVAYIFWAACNESSPWSVSGSSALAWSTFSSLQCNSFVHIHAIHSFFLSVYGAYTHPEVNSSYLSSY